MTRASPTRNVSAALLMGLLVAGCAAPPPLSDAERRQIHSIALITPPTRCQLVLDRPLTPGQGMAAGAGEGLVAGLDSAREMGDFSGVGAVAAAIVLSPIGAIAGGFSGVPAKKSEPAFATLSTALQDLPVNQTILERITTAADRQTRHRIVPLTGPQPSYPNLAAQGFDAVLEITPEAAGLVSSKGRNPYSPRVAARMRLLMLPDGTPIREYVWVRSGRNDNFLAWAREDGAPARQAVEQCAARIGADLARWLVPALEPDQNH